MIQDYEQRFIITNPEYNEGFVLDMYNEKFSLVAANQGKEGKIFKKWCFPSVYDKEQMQGVPSSKTLPVKIELGKREDAIQILLEALELLGAELPGPERLPDYGQTEKPADYQTQGGDPEYGDIPFS